MERPVNLAIRLARHGCANRPFFYIVVMPKYGKRDAPYLEQIGSYDPTINLSGERLVALNFTRLRYWLAQGASANRTVQKLLGYAGFYPIHPNTYIQAKRKREGKPIYNKAL